MKNVTILLALAAALSVDVPVAAQQTIPTIAQSEVKAHVGRVATVCGVIVSISCHGKDRRVWFDMSEPYWGGASLVVAETDRPRLGPRLGRFLLRPMCGTGRIEKHKGGFLLETKPEDLRQEGPASTMPSAFGGEAYTPCDDGVSMPALVREVRAVYTREAVVAKKEGKALVEAVVLADGQVGDTIVAVSLDADYGLDGQAVAAVNQWLFKPATLRGQPVPVIISVEVEFNLGDKKLRW